MKTDLFEICFTKRLEFREVSVLQKLLHLSDVWEITGRDTMGLAQFGVSLLEVGDQLGFGLFFAEHGGHVVVQMGNDEAMDLKRSELSTENKLPWRDELA